MVFDAQALFESSLKNDGINLFLGAGFSVLSSNLNGEKLPLGEGLKNSLINSF